jgi:hypothetical protein
MDIKVASEIATAEVNKWLELKKIGEKKREDKKDSIDAMIGAICEGLLIIDEKGFITQKLKFQIKDESGKVELEELKYKPRLSTAQIQACLAGTKLTDLYALPIALIAALTDQSKSIIKLLDSEDSSVGQSIANFFL